MAIGNAFPNCPKFFLESGSFLLGRMITIFGTISFADLSTNISDSLSMSMDVSYLYYVAVAANFTTVFAKKLGQCKFYKTFY
ncbi:MAG: hypothetical protein ACK47R_15935, partial [Planctomycetia bacterium]